MSQSQKAQQATLTATAAATSGGTAVSGSPAAAATPTPAAAPTTAATFAVAVLTAATLALGATSSYTYAQSGAQDEAQGSWGASGNVALTSDYKFRGISQSDESWAIQGGFDLEHDSGFYLGAWASSVDFDPDDEDYDGSMELDLYLGFGGDLGGTGLTYDVGYIYYDYPGDDGDEGDYQEFYLGLGWQDLSVGLAYSNDYYAESDTFWYISADYSLSLPSDFTLDLHVGYNILDDEGGFLQGMNGMGENCDAGTTGCQNEDAYTDYSVSLSRDLMGVNFALALVGTDLDEEDVFDTDWGDNIVQFTLSKSL